MLLLKSTAALFGAGNLWGIVSVCCCSPGTWYLFFLCTCVGVTQSCFFSLFAVFIVSLPRPTQIQGHVAHPLPLPTTRRGFLFFRGKFQPFLPSSTGIELHIQRLPTLQGALSSWFFLLFIVANKLKSPTHVDSNSKTKSWLILKNRSIRR